MRWAMPLRRWPGLELLKGLNMKLAINGGNPVRTKAFPQWPVWDELEKRNLESVLESRKWGSVQGEHTSKFEAEFAAYQNARFGVATTSGTTALDIAIRSVGVQAGDEVILPAYTFIASAIAILNNGAVPVFVDIDSTTYNIDPAKIAEKITARTRAIMPVHFAGRPADMDAIQAIARRHNLYVIEDAAQAWGAQWRGTGVGALGELGCFSFQSSKNITAGEGGIMLTNSDEYAKLAASYSNCGRMPDGMWYAHYLMAGNARITEFQAAVLRAQLARFPQHLRVRQASMAFLDKHFAALPGLSPLAQDERITSHACHLYILRYASEQLDDLPKERFVETLRAEGIPCSPGYSIPLYQQPVFENREFGPFKALLKDRVQRPVLPMTERACRDEAIWLTQNVLLDGEAGMQSVIDACEKVVKYRHELNSGAQ